MHIKLLLAIFFTLFMLTTAHADEKYVVQNPAILASSAPIAQGVEASCGLPALVGNTVSQRVKAKFPLSSETQLPNQDEKDKVLNLTILSAYGVGGGSWSGKKSMSLRADVVQSGRVIRTYSNVIASGGGAFGGLSGTCPIFGRIAEAFAKEVVNYLSQQTYTEEAAPVPLPKPN